MNITEIDRIMKYVEKGEKEKLVSFLEKEREKAAEKTKIQYLKASGKVIRELKIGTEGRKVSYFEKDGKIILISNHSLYIFNKRDIIDYYNNVLAKENGWSNIDLADDKTKTNIIKAIQKFEEEEYIEIGSIYDSIYYPEEEMEDGVILSSVDGYPVFEINGMYSTIFHCFNKDIFGYSKTLLGKDTKHLIANNHKKPVLYAKSEKGKAYILGLKPNTIDNN